MRKKYGLTQHEQKLLSKAQYYQNKAAEMHRKFADSLQNRFYNSTTISEFEEWDLWRNAMYLIAGVLEMGIFDGILFAFLR